MTLLHTLVVLLPGLGALAMLFLSAYAFSGARAAGRRSFGVFAALVGLWCAMAALEYLVVDFGLKSVFGRLVYLGAATSPVAWFVFSCHYTQRERLVRPPMIAALSLAPLLTLVLVFTNDQHGWIWASVEYATTPLPDLVITHGWWFRRVHLGYSYGLFLLGVIVLVSRFFSDVAAYRAQIFGVVLSAFVVFLANLAYTLGGVTLAGLDPSPALAAVFSLGVGVSVFRGFLSLQPLSYRAVFMAMEDPVVLIDQNGFVVDANPRAERLAGQRPSPGIHLAQFLPWIGQGNASVRHAGHSFSVKWVELAGGSGAETGRAVVLHDTTAEVRQRQLLETMARQDSLTQALNRGAFEALLHQQLEQRRKEWPLAILFLDLNDFKRVNDTLGHAAGDEVLRELARRVQGVLRPGDLLARLGGDEFTVLLDRADASIAGAVAQRIADRLSKPFQLGERQLIASASIGHAVWPEDGGTFEALLDAADRRMYEVKRGKSRE